ncbi:hypothetical protein TNCV_4881951 [Trichonephila clavipes]|nr:hypothetical protein TNCV_4881951 [Trichonephila clavipes]
MTSLFGEQCFPRGHYSYFGDEAFGQANSRDNACKPITLIVEHNGYDVGGKGREVGDPDPPAENWSGTEPNCTAICMVLKATASDRRTSIPLPRQISWTSI